MLRKPARALTAPLAIMAALAIPGIAAAEGPGYDGRADALVVTREGTPQTQTTDQQVGLVVFGRGFRGGSAVTLQVGAAGEQTAVADSTGALRAEVDAAPGTTIAAVGQSPSGSTWTLLGSVPSTHANRVPQALAGALLGLLGVFGLISPVLMRMAYWGRGRPVFYRPAHGSNR